MNSKNLALISVAAIALIGLIIFIAMNRDTRDWAEVTVISVSGDGPNGFDIKLEESHVNGGGIKSEDLINGTHAGGGESRGTELFIFGPPKDSAEFGFGLTPDRGPGAVVFTNSPQFRKLLALVGKKRRFYVGEEFSLYDFTFASNHYQCIYTVIPRD